MRSARECFCHQAQNFSRNSVDKVRGKLALENEKS